MDTPISIFSTKKLNSNVAQQLQQRDDLVYTEANFIKTSPVPFSIDYSPFTTAIFTSSNAVKYVAAFFPDPTTVLWEIFCLEGNTKKEIIKTFSANNIVATAEDAASLAKKVIAFKKNKKVQFFCGHHRRNELPEMLHQQGIQLKETVVYDTISTPISVQEQQDAILFFSPSAVESFFRTNQLSATTTCFAIGNTTANALRNKTNNNIITSQHPDQEALLDAIFTHFQLPHFEPFEK